MTTSPRLLSTLDRGLSLVARIAYHRSGAFDSGRVGAPLPRYMILLEREARVRRIIRERVEIEMIAAEAIGGLR